MKRTENTLLHINKREEIFLHLQIGKSLQPQQILSFIILNHTDIQWQFKPADSSTKDL